jgi:homoaconitase/3-isopropylmalate dehydratase large subunit
MILMGMTIAEKILAAHAIPPKEEIKPGEFLWARIDETNAFGDALAYMKKLGIKRVFDPDGVFMVDDHAAPPTNVAVAEDVARALGARL